jgi:3',5'-cyclic AMP phosphodiesterase CpdA
MTERTLAHLSDLHVGRGDPADEALERMCRELLRRRVDHVVVTGDVTHRGRRNEWDRFRTAFAALDAEARLTIVPGNHDRLNDDVAASMMADQRVRVEAREDLYLVCFDSTGPHNRSFLASHGQLTGEDLEAIIEAFARAPEGVLAVLLLHHHLLPLPHDNRAEMLASWLGWGSGGELELGAELLAALRGRCDLVLHGHRHDPGSTAIFAEDARPLSLFNAGSSTDLGHVRLFVHHGARLTAPPRWLSVGRAGPAAFVEYIGSPPMTGPGWQAS